MAAEAAVGFVAAVTAAGLDLEGLLTHFATIGGRRRHHTAQLAALLRVAGEVRVAGHAPNVLHAANTGATSPAPPEAHLDLVRPGIGIYGLYPDPASARDLGLRPALSWRSRVTFAKRLESGERLSYGHHYRLDRDAWVATVPVGYADGYPGLCPRGPTS